MDSKCFEEQLIRIQKCYDEERRKLDKEIKDLKRALEYAPGVNDALLEERSALKGENAKLHGQVKALHTEINDERGRFSKYKKQVLRATYAASIVFVAETTFILATATEGVGSFLGLTTAEFASVDARAAAEAAKLVREASKMRKEILAEIEQKTARGQENGACAKAGYRAAGKILEKVVKKLEDKAIEAGDDAAVGIVQHFREERRQRCVKYADADS